MSIDFLSILNPSPTKKKKFKIDFTKLIEPDPEPEPEPEQEQKPILDFSDVYVAQPIGKTMTTTPSMLLPQPEARKLEDIKTSIGAPPKAPFKQPVVDKSMTEEEAVQDAMDAWAKGTLPADIIKRKAIAKENIPRVTRNVKIGLAGTAGSAVSGLEWLAPKILKPKLSEVAKNIESNIEILAEENPTFMDSLVQGAASSALFFIPGIGVSKGLQALGMVGKWGLRAGLTVTTSLESMAEAGGVYRTSLDRGLSEKEASKKASQTFWANIAVIGITNKYGIFSDKITNNLFRALASSPLEGVQEGLQQIIQNFENDRPLMEGVTESALIGAIVGAPMGLIGGTRITPDVTRRLIEEKLGPLPDGPPSPLVSFSQQDEVIKEQWRQEAIDKAFVNFKNVQKEQLTTKKPLVDFKKIIGEQQIPAIKADQLISHEGAPDTTTTAEYVKKIQAGETIEPIKVIEEGDKFGIEDGKHRFEAYQQLGIKNIPIEVIKPTVKEVEPASVDQLVLEVVEKKFEKADEITKLEKERVKQKKLSKDINNNKKDEAKEEIKKINSQINKIKREDAEAIREIAGEEIIVGKRPVFSKRELKTLIENVPEFKARPKLKVISKDGEKLLQFKTDKIKFSIKAKVLGLVEKNLKDGQEIIFDADSLKIKGEEIRVVKRKKGYKQSESKEGVSSGNYYASKGEFSPIDIPNHVTNIEMPELVKLMKSLLDGRVPFIRKYPSAWGKFYADPANPRIGLNPKIFEDEGKAIKTFAHEIGHMIDFLPEANITRGNLLNRLESLIQIRKGIFGDEALIKQRKNLMSGISQLNRLEKTRKLTVDEVLRRDKKINLFNEINEKLVFEKDMRDELKALSQFWKPFDPATNPNHTAYRYSSPELYADFISVLFNRPDLAKVKAPKFHKRFFDYMENNPEVKKQYFELMDFLTGKREDILDTREADIRKSFQTATELEIQKMSEGLDKSTKEKASSMVRSVNKALIEKNIALVESVEKVIKSGKTIAPSKNPAILLEELDTIKNEISNVFDKVGVVDTALSKEGLTDVDFSTYLFYKRITGDRATKANPFGATKSSATEGLKRMKEKLGKEKFSVLESSAIKLNEINKEEIKLGVENGLYSQELFNDLTKGDNIYATFKILDYVLSGSVTSNMIAQIGTFKDIGQTYQATIAKMVAIRVAAHKNDFKKVSGEFFLDNFSQDETIKADIPEIARADILKAKIDPRTGGAPQSKISKAGDQLELITWRDGGKMKGIYVDPEIAASYKYDSQANTQLIKETIGLINNKVFRKAYIDYSIRFIVRNPIRDLRQAWRALSMVDLQGTGPFKITFREFVSGIKRAYPDARAFAKGVKTRTVQNVLDDKIMGVDEDYKMTKEDLDESTALSREMRKRGLHLEQIKKDSPSKNPFVHLGNFIIQVGKTAEAITKITAYQAIEKQLNMRDSKINKETAQFIRNNIGTPNWRKGGTLTPTTNVISMFSNVAFQGYKRGYHLVTKPNTRSGYMWRTAQIALIPKLLMWMASAGLMGDELEKLYSRVSTYKKRNYLVIPLGSHNNKTVSVTLPFDYDERLMTAIMWTALDSIKNKSVKGADMWNLISAEMPSLTNTIALPLAWIEYFRGINPRDNWRGRDVLTDQEFRAGGFSSLEPMLRWSWNQILSGIIKVDLRDSVRKQTWLEKTSHIGGINAFISIEDYGLQENIMKDQKKTDKVKAGEELKQKKVIIDNLRNFYKSGESDNKIDKYINQAMKEQFKGKIVTITEENSFRKSFMREMMKTYNNSWMTDLVYSDSIDKQIIAIKEIKENADKDVFNKIQALFLNSRIISYETWDRALYEFRKEEKEGQ